MSDGAFMGEFYARRAEGVIFPLLYLRRGGAKRRGGQVLPVDEANIGDPVTLSARETRFNIFAFEVQTPPCFTQNVQPHARAGISGGSPSHSSSKAILPQWHLPVMSMWISTRVGLQCT